jgi:hypothetical protein
LSDSAHARATEGVASLTHETIATIPKKWITHVTRQHEFK